MNELESDELRVLQDAAAGGNAAAQVTLGLAHELGHGVVRDPLYAGYLYRQAALAGEPRGQFALGQLYEYGIGVEPSIETALPWYSLAAAQGHREACRRLGQHDAGSPNAMWPARHPSLPDVGPEKLPVESADVRIGQLRPQ